MKRFITALILLTLLALIACAPKEKAPEEQPAEAKEEVSDPTVIKSILDFHDTDKDMIITLEEHKTNTKRLFDLRDANGDGMQDEKEVMAKFKIIFHRWDIDKDGKITKDEMKTAIVGDGWQEIDITGLECPDNPPLKFKSIDLNGDGKIERAEHLSFIEKRFAMMDMNADEVVDENELDDMLIKENQAMDQDGDQIVTFEEHALFRYAE